MLKQTIIQSIEHLQNYQANKHFELDKVIVILKQSEMVKEAENFNSVRDDKEMFIVAFNWQKTWTTVGVYTLVQVNKERM